MRRSLSAALVQLSTIAFALTLVVRPAAAAGDLVPLARLAPQLGYTYTWIAAESAVALTRPGLYVLVRTGNPLYDVNDSIESTAQAPVYRNNDILVGTSLAARLRSLASAAASRSTAAKPLDMGPSVAAAPIRGTLTVAVVPTDTSDAVIVRGTGPANAPLTITFSADITRDLPRIVLSRTSTETDASGSYSVQISSAPLHMRNSLVLVSATSGPGVTEAHTTYVLGQPSPKIAHPVDELPHDYRPH
jgi:hypothetical protein